MVLVLYAGTGTETYDFYNVPVSITEAELAACAWDSAVEHAESYGIYPESGMFEDDDDSYKGDEYSAEIEGYWEDYDPEEHDGRTMRGTPSWQDY